MSKIPGLFSSKITLTTLKSYIVLRRKASDSTNQSGCVRNESRGTEGAGGEVVSNMMETWRLSEVTR